MKLYGIKNCDTVKKARAWLDTRHLEYEFHDLRIDGLNGAMIDRWLNSVDVDLLLNRRSTTWKSLDSDVRENLPASDIPGLLIANPTLVKRPVLEGNGGVVVGFNEKTYNGFFGFQEFDE